MAHLPAEPLPPHDLQRRREENPNDRIRVAKEFFAERAKVGDVEGAAYAQTVIMLEMELEAAIKEGKNMPIKEASPILKLIVVLGFLAGIAFAAFGVWLVYLGSTGQTEFSFFWQTFKSANVGIGAIFIGGVLIVLLARSVLKTLRHFK